jgi:hypothetical protein
MVERVQIQLQVGQASTQKDTHQTQERKVGVLIEVRSDEGQKRLANCELEKLVLRVERSKVVL